MSCTIYFDGDTLIHQLDPRARIVVTFLFSALMAVSWQPAVLVAGLTIGVGLALVPDFRSDRLPRDYCESICSCWSCCCWFLLHNRANRHSRCFRSRSARTEFNGHCA